MQSGWARWAAVSTASTRTTLKSESFANDPAVPTSLGAAGVMSLLEVDKQLWVGTFGGGISRFDARTRRFENLRPGPEDGLHLSNGRVTALARDRSGHVWIGTDGGGLNVWDLKTRRLYYYKRDAKQLDYPQRRHHLFDPGR